MISSQALISKSENNRVRKRMPHGGVTALPYLSWSCRSPVEGWIVCGEQILAHFRSGMAAPGPIAIRPGVALTVR